MPETLADVITESGRLTDHEQRAFIAGIETKDLVTLLAFQAEFMSVCDMLRDNISFNVDNTAALEHSYRTYDATTWKLQAINALVERRAGAALKPSNGHKANAPQPHAIPAVVTPLSDALPFNVLSADTILETVYPEPVYVVPDVLPVGLASLGGRPKVGKSWMGLQIAHAVGTGGYVLGKKVDRAPVLYLALEDSPRRIQNRMNGQGWQKGASVDFLHVGDMRQVGMLHEGGAEKIHHAMRIKGYRLVVIDTFSRALRGLDPKKTHLVASALEKLHEAAHDENGCIFTIDHLRKPGSSRKADIVNDLIDSTVKAAIADTIWGLYRERGKAGAKLQVTGKDVYETTLALQFDHVTRCWQSIGDAAQIITPIQKQYLEIVRKYGSTRANQIAGETDKALSNVVRELKELVNKGHLLYDEQSRLYSLQP